MGRETPSGRQSGVEGRSPDPDRDFARAGLRVVDLVELEDVGAAELVEPNRFHCLDLPSAACTNCVYV
jgi:hypothetical protein